MSRNGWVLAAAWLVFLVPTMVEILADDRTGSFAKAVSTVLILAFAATYIDGFRQQQRRHRQADDALAPVGSWAGRMTSGTTHFFVLAGLALALGLAAGIEALGLVVFVVVFAMFQFAWPIAWSVYVAGVALTAVLPLSTGQLGDFWFLAMVVAGVGAAAALIRAFEGHQLDQAHLRTGMAIVDERSRVARDVHDVLGHSLTAVILKTELCQRLLEPSSPAAPIDPDRIDACRQQLAELDSVSRRALAEIRATVGGLRSTDVLDEVTAARTVLADAGVDLLVTGDAAELADQHRPMLAWVVREAVTNVVRHSEAGRCEIELAPAAGTVLRISDDGVGLGTSEQGNGLTGLRERVASAGGTLRVHSPIASASEGSAAGTMIEVVV